MAAILPRALGAGSATVAALFGRKIIATRSVARRSSEFDSDSDEVSEMDEAAERPVARSRDFPGEVHRVHAHRLARLPLEVTPRAPRPPNHAKRRAALAAAFPGETLVIPTGGEKVRANDTVYPFRPGSDFMWLTGEHDPERC